MGRLPLFKVIEMSCYDVKIMFEFRIFAMVQGPIRLRPRMGLWDLAGLFSSVPVLISWGIRLCDVLCCSYGVESLRTNPASAVFECPARSQDCPHISHIRVGRVS